MTKIIDGVHVLEYKEWEKIPAVKELADNFEDCASCDGDGTYVCSCGNEHDCEECGGSGKDGDLLEMYHAELKSELHKLLVWKSKIPLPE